MRSSSLFRITAAFSLGALLAVGASDLAGLSSASAAESRPTISVTDASGASSGTLADLGAAGQGKYTLATDLVCPAGATNFDYMIEPGVITEPEEFSFVQNLARYTYSTYADVAVNADGSIPASTAVFPGAPDSWWAKAGRMFPLSDLQPGTYSLGVTCTTKGSDIWLDEEKRSVQAWTTLTVTGSGWSVPAVAAPAVQTTTTIVATTSATDETAADLVATVVAASGTAAGTVQFFDGPTAVGAPVALTDTGTASSTATGLAAGDHSFTASFTATDPAAFGPSASATPALLTIVGSVKAQTSVTLAGSASGTDANLVATVSSDGAPVTTATGRVEFSDGAGAKVADAAVNASGVATATISGLTPGASYSYTAVYMATASENFLSSAASSVLTIEVARVDETPLLTAGGVVVPGQKYRVVVPEGTFVAGETVRGEIRSTPIILSETAVAREDGSAEFIFTAPRDLEAGSAHELMLTGEAGAEYTLAFTVKAADSTVVPVSALKPGTNSPVGFATDWIGGVASTPQGIAGLFAGLLGLAALLVGGTAWVTSRGRGGPAVQ